MSEMSDGGGPRRKVWWAAGGGLLLVILLIFVFSGGGDPNGAPGDTSSGTETSMEDLDRQLQATLTGLRPENLNVSRDTESLVDDLNIWWLDAQAMHTLESADAESEAVGEHLGSAAQQQSAASQFNQRDAGHIRNALLFRSLAETVVRFAETDLQRSVVAFDLVSRQMAPVVGGSERAPRTAFETLIYGRGRPEDRAWAFAEILRQLRIDCVILTPRGSGDASRLPWLVGVVIPDSGVYLFDPELRLPIPALSGNDEAELVDQPATLSEALANDAVFRQFDSPQQPYPLTSAQLAGCSVQAITQSGFSAARMHSLQMSLPAEFRTTLFDGLVASSEEQQGILGRLAAIPELSSGTIGVWPYPEQQTAGFYAAGGETSPELQSEFAVLRAPRTLQRKATKDGVIEIEVDSQRPLRYVRVEHLRGDFTAALQNYGAIRSSPSGNASSVNLEASEFAAFWIAVCQYEMQRTPAALGNCDLYRQMYPQGLWIDSIRELAAQCHVREGRFRDASQLLEQATAPTQRDAYLIRHWQSRSESGTDGPE